MSVRKIHEAHPALRFIFGRRELHSFSAQRIARMLKAATTGS
jgi:hypothetical protein